MTTVRRGGAEGGPQAAALRVLAVLMGVFLIGMGLAKIGWFMDGAILARQLQNWHTSAGPLARWYLDTFAMPGVPVFARLVPLGELVTGTALVLGVRVRIAATVALLMVMNFHVAAGVMFTFSYLTNAYGPPVLGGLLALAIGGTRLPFSVTR